MSTSFNRRSILKCRTFLAWGLQMSLSEPGNVSGLLSPVKEETYPLSASKSQPLRNLSRLGEGVRRAEPGLDGALSGSWNVACRFRVHFFPHCLFYSLSLYAISSYCIDFVQASTATKVGEYFCTAVETHSEQACTPMACFAKCKPTTMGYVTLAFYPCCAPIPPSPGLPRHL